MNKTENNMMQVTTIKNKIITNISNIVIPFIYILCIMLLCGCSASQTPVSRTGFYFDTVIQVALYDWDNKTDSGNCLDGCMELADKYEKMLSATTEDSDIWNINHSHGQPVAVSDETFMLLETAVSYCDMSGGLIDFTVESVSGLWDFKPDSAGLPDENSILEALKHINYDGISLDNISNTVTLKDPEAAISLGFIAKGFIADKMKEYLLSNNVKSAIINLGGNLLAVGSKPDGTPFQFGIQKPFDEQGAIIASLPVSNRSLVSSGVYERYFYKDDVLYHHILNPKTGYPVRNNLLGVTILSDSSMEGDALSTTCFVLGLDKGMELIESLDGVDAVFITEDYELHYSKGIKQKQPSLH